MKRDYSHEAADNAESGKIDWCEAETRARLPALLQEYGETGEIELLGIPGDELRETADYHRIATEEHIENVLVDYLYEHFDSLAYEI